MNYLESNEGRQHYALTPDGKKSHTTRRTQITISFLEIYNENVNDLLSPQQKPLEVRENKNGEVIVEGLTSQPVSSIDEFMYWVNKGNEIKFTASTGANAKSSRSHTILRVMLEQEETNTQTGRNVLRQSQLNLVDLAGSEGASKTKSQGMRFREGGNINKSLLALSNVVGKLSQR